MGHGCRGPSVKVSVTACYESGSTGRPGLWLAGKDTGIWAENLQIKRDQGALVAGTIRRQFWQARTGLRRGLDGTTAPEAVYFLPGLSPLRVFHPCLSWGSSSAPL